MRCNLKLSRPGLLLALGLAGCGGGGSGSAELNLSPNAPPPPAGMTGQPYPAFTFASPTGGAGPFTWTESGALPKGMSLGSNGLLSGTPTTAGTFPITLTVTDSSSPHLTTRESITLTIKDSPLVISASQPPAGFQSTPYPGFSFTASGGSQPVTWRVSSGSLPAGLALSTTGILSGTPSGSTGSTFTVTATDSATSPESAQRQFTITISPATSISITCPGKQSCPGVVPAGTSIKLQATVISDPNNGGINWAVMSCNQGPQPAPAADCGSVSPTVTANNGTVTYTAPAIPPAGDVTLAVIATSQTAPLVNFPYDFTIPGISVAVIPTSALLPLNISQAFTATVANDGANKGVTWAPSQNGAACAPACGSLSPVSTASGAPTTYTAPAVLPANEAVVLTASSIEQPLSFATGSVTLTGGSISVVPDDLSFTGCPTTKCPVPQQDAVLTNTGGSALNITGVTIGGTNPADFQESQNCGASLAAGASCKVTVGYQSGARGVHTAVISIADASTDSPQQLFLTGINKATVGAAAVVAALKERTAIYAPPPTGIERVGTRILHLVDSSRADPYLSNGARRELLVRLWYPSSDSGCTRAEYTSAGVVHEFSRLLATALPRIVANSCLNAAVAAGAHPVVLMTPGFTGTFTDYTFLAEDLASHGYVVASVDHTHEAVAVEFPDGRVEKGLFGSGLTNYTRSDLGALRLAVSVRIADLRFVADRLAAMSAGGDAALAGKLDLSRTALLGHSLGGMTAIRGVESDSRFRAAISLDGLVPDHQTPPTRKPVLLFRAGTSPWNENDCQQWSALQGERTTLNLTGAEHTAFSDLLWLAPEAVASGPMGVDGTIKALRTVSAEFLNRVFTGTSVGESALRSMAKNPQAVVTLREQSRCSPSP
jgi:dienelactone hydrolase